MRYLFMVVLAVAALFLQGCAELEPRTGTRVDIAFDKPITREQLVVISKYLTNKGELVLGIKRPRIDSVSDKSLVLLLPGKKVSKADVNKLIQPYSVELYHLNKVATKNSPNRPWKIKAPITPDGPYLFSGPNATRIDSKKDNKELLTEIVGYPHTKPILTGRDILPNAYQLQTKNGWTVHIKFNEVGAKTFYEFSKANPGEYLAVFYNGRLVSAPIIRDPISGGEAFITGFAREQHARTAVAEINGGTLPLHIKITGVDYY